MNWKTTLALGVLAAAGAGLYWTGFKLPRDLDPVPPPPALSDAGTRAFLDGLRPEALTRIEIRRAAGDVVVLQRAPGGAWSLPGGWPTRPLEVRALVEQLGGLRTRFAPEPASDGAPRLASCGLAPPALTVLLETDARKHRLDCGEALGEGNRFSRETYLRLDNLPEVVRLGPGVVATLDRPADYYQQRRLFDADRVAKEDNKQEKVEQLKAKSLAVADRAAGGTRFTLVRGADGWELGEPRDRLDPRARESLLAAVPDVWVERFLRPEPAAGAAGGLFWATPQGLLLMSGLSAPERTLEVTRDDGTKATLLIGRVSSRRTRRVLRTPPPGVPIPPREEPVTEEFRYAKLSGNDQVFEIKGDKLKDVFVAADTLRDPRTARFKPEDARRVAITQNGVTAELVKDGDRWKVVKPFAADAEAGKVTELLSSLSGLEAREKEDRIDRADPKAYALDKPAAEVRMTIEEEVPGPGEAREKKQRTLAVKLGKHDAAAKKLFVQAEGWPRLDKVDDGVLALATRPAVAYRNRHVLDFASADLAAVAVRRADGKTMTLQRDMADWKVTTPFSADADATKAADVADRLGKLEAAEFVAESPTPADLDKQYGLARPALAVTLTFADKGKQARTLEVGKAKDSKSGYFARVADAPAVFVVDNDLHNLLDRDVLALLRAEQWRLSVADIASVRVRKEGQAEYRLIPATDGYRIAGPFDAAAQPTAGQVLTDELLAPRAENYVAMEAKDPAEYGLDKPHLRGVVVGKDGKEHVLEVGKQNPKGGRYARASGRPAVFTVGDRFLAAVDRGPLDLLDRQLLSVDLGQADWMQYKSGNSMVTLERQGDGWRVVDAPGAPYAADSEAIAALAATWFVLKAEGFADYAPKDWAKYGLDKPSVIARVRLKKGVNGAAAEHVVKFGKSTPSAGILGRYARVDGGPAVAVLDLAVTEGLGRTSLDFVGHKILVFDPRSVTSIQRQKGPDTLELDRKDDGWRLIKPTEARADDLTLNELMARLGDLRATRIAAYPAKDLKPFGLDEPQSVVTIKLTGDKKPGEHRLKIGAYLGKGQGNYAMVDDSPVVAILPQDLMVRLEAKPLAFHDRTVARVAPVDTLKVERGPRRATFTRSDGTWKLTEPLTAEADGKELDAFASSLSRLRAESLVAEHPDAAELKQHGLDRPEAEWSVGVGGKEVLRFAIGNRVNEKDSRCYARVVGRDLVFLLDEVMARKVLGEFRTTNVWAVPPDPLRVGSLRFGYATDPFVLDRGAGGWQVVGKSDVKLNQEAVNDTLAALSDLKLFRYVVDKDTDLKLFGLDVPYLALEIATRDGKQTLQLGRTEGSSKRRYARVTEAGRTGVFLLNEAVCSRVLRDLAAFTRPPAVPPQRRLP